MKPSPQNIADYKREKAVGDWVEQIVKSSYGQERIILEISGMILEAQSDTKYISEKYEELADAVKMVAHAIKTLGLCNPDMQLARLDTDSTKDWARVSSVFMAGKLKQSVNVKDLSDFNRIFIAGHVLKGDIKDLEELLTATTEI
jgi:hypothetical protein